MNGSVWYANHKSNKLLLNKKSKNIDNVAINDVIKIIFFCINFSLGLFLWKSINGINIVIKKNYYIIPYNCIS